MTFPFSIYRCPPHTRRAFQWHKNIILAHTNGGEYGLNENYCIIGAVWLWLLLLLPFVCVVVCRLVVGITGSHVQPGECAQSKQIHTRTWMWNSTNKIAAHEMYKEADRIIRTHKHIVIGRCETYTNPRSRVNSRAFVCVGEFTEFSSFAYTQPDDGIESLCMFFFFLNEQKIVSTQ